MLNFGQKVEEKSSDVIPKDSLAWAVINIRGFKNSQETNGRYMDIELTIADGIPYARRKIWEMIADPFDANNSEEWRSMGYGSIRRILEAVKGATPDNVNSYTLNRLEDLHGLMVPIIVKIEKAKPNSGYDDKNKAEFLSPHSSVKKIVESFNLLQQGVYLYGKPEKPASAPPQGSMFAGTASTPPATMQHQPAAAPQAAPGGQAPGWLAPTGQAPQQPQQGAPVPQQQAPVNTGFVAPAANHAPAHNTGGQAPVPNASTSPSSGWQPPAAGAPAQFPGSGQ